MYVGIIVNIMSSTEIAGTSKPQELLNAGIWLTLLVVISLFAKNWALFTMQSNLGRARLAICGLLYKKLNSTSLTSLHEVKLGKVINLLSNDLNPFSVAGSDVSQILIVKFNENLEHCDEKIKKGFE